MKNNISSLSDIYNLVVENYVREYNISASAKELWLDALEPISMEGNVVTLATDTDFKRNTINSIYLEKLEEQFTIVLGNPIKVEIGKCSCTRRIQHFGTMLADHCFRL